MRLQDDIDFTTLNWVKAELDQTLEHARVALEAYTEDTNQLDQMRICAASLHQVQGTLRMVELYGAAMVVEEMERLADGIIADEIRQRDEAYSVLMRGIVQLPDYLERLQSGHRDIPIVLLPLLNDLRSCRGEKLLSESVLFAPDLSAALPPSASGSAYLVPLPELRSQVLRLRLAFQAALLKWFRAQEADHRHPDRLHDILDRLRALSHSAGARELWWVAAGVIEAVRDGALDASVTVKLLFGRVDREIRAFAEAGDASWRGGAPRELIQNLLYYIAHSNGSGERTTEIRRHYRLDELIPTQSEIEHAQGSLGGRNRSLLGTVSTAIKDDLIRVKESLDIFLRARDADPAQLVDQVEVLDRVADTLGMLGLGTPRRVVGEQRIILESVAHGPRESAEGVLLDVAGALLYVEASLDEHIEHLGGGDEAQAKRGSLDLPRTEVRKLLESLMREAEANFHQAKQSIIAFIESPWDHSKIGPIPALLNDVSGALSMLDLSDAATLTNGLVRFVEVELLRHHRVPTTEQMDALADAITSIEYYLEATREQRSGRDRILDLTRESLNVLGYWPIPPLEELPVSGAPEKTVDAAPHDSASDDAGFAVSGQTEHDQFPSWSDDLSSSRNEALRFGASDADDGSDADMPSVELPDINTVAIDTDWADQPESDSAATDDTARREAAHPDLTSAIDIAAGGDLQDLVVGDAVPLQLPEHDLTGMRLAADASNGRTDSDQADCDWIEVEEIIEESVPIYTGADVHFDAAASSEIDDDIREVFIEEVQEELERMQHEFGAWKAELDNVEHLTTIRRSFHTLKGSGRLVGAKLLGEFSWKVENMLNRVLDGSVAPKPEVVSLVDHAIAALPGFLAALQGADEPLGDIDGIMSTADQLANGVDARMPETPRMHTVERIVRRRVLVERDTAAVLPEDVSAITDLSATDAEWTGAPASTIDPVLREILSKEVAMHVATITDYLDACDSEPGGLVPSESVVRAVHTLNGAISMVDIANVSHALAPLESYVKRLRAAHLCPDESGQNALAECVELLRNTMMEINSDPSSAVGGLDRPDLIARIIALRDAQPQLDLTTREATLDTAAQDEGATTVEEEPIETEASTAQVDDVVVDVIGEATSAEAEDERSFDRESGFEAEFAAAIDEDAASMTELAAESDAVTESDASRTFEADDETQTEPMAEVLPGADIDFEVESQIKTEAQAEIEADTEADSEAAIGMDDGMWSDDIIPADDDIDADTQTSKDRVFDVAGPIHDEPEVDHEAVAIDGSDSLAGIETGVVSWTDLESETEADAEGEAELDTATGAAAEDPDDPTAALVDHFNSMADIDPEFAASVGRDEAPESVDNEEADAAPAQFDVDLESADTREAPDSEQEPVTPEPAERETLAAWIETALRPAESDSVPEKVEELKENAAAVALRNMPAPPEFPSDEQPQGPLVLPDYDEELIDIFVQEGNDLLDDTDAQMARVRAAPDELGAIAGMQRDLHTLKGGARMAGIEPIGDLAHSMESLLEAITEGQRRIDRTVVESLEVGFDRLHELLQRITRKQAISIPVNAVARFEELVAGEATPAIADADATTEVPPAAPPPRRMPSIEDEETPHAPQEMIRVRSDLLDSLVNYAGEVSIYRSRLEQQISSFRFNLVELDQTVSRLRDQLRMLEMETEAQIIARYQREHEGDPAAFDPLELDRFSQLQQYSRALGESVSDLVSLQNLLDDQTRQSETLLLQQSRVSSDLQEGLMRTRMVPFDSMVPSLRRTVRQAGQELGKHAQLSVEGAHGEMDRNLLERMKAPFEHMLRNAIAHGIESPAQRKKAGKPDEGRINIAVSREATEVVLRVSDDGAGFDREAIRAKAIQRGLMKPEATLPDRDIYAFVLDSGFSTASEVSKLSGRGVGMDVVHNEIKQIGGTLQIDSTPGKGAEFTLRLPFTLAVTQAILVRIGESVYAIPMSSVQGVARIAREALDQRIADDDMRYQYGGEDYTIYELTQLLGLPPSRLPGDAQLPMLMIRTAERRVAVRIDAVVGSREIVVKSVGPQVSRVPGIFGATIMGDGSVLMILDLAPLVRRAEALREEGTESVYVPPLPAQEKRRQPLVMVVDDSITMRKVTTRVLERVELEVVTAKDGLDAVEKLQDRIPDLMLLDIEMPRMDGYELATYMKNDSRMKGIPIIMITSRTGEKHRQRAMEIGVERYLGKPYQETDLLKQVQEMLEVKHG